ncbi:hypothetical protein [Pseudomonas sp. FP1742]|uniref:hypothetical protein n=1 Tax=Pseudomonas sp. FP1742 TaxID=2954079 RepID=UPI002735A97B|nr:hypothetical protein [Pseudomonas sp. FP1742]WLG48870.1 hypothetical protein PSH64_19310 [Pseudomonas sp. FP1742]
MKKEVQQSYKAIQVDDVTTLLIENIDPALDIESLEFRAQARGHDSEQLGSKRKTEHFAAREALSKLLKTIGRDKNLSYSWPSRTAPPRFDDLSMSVGHSDNLVIAGLTKGKNRLSPELAEFVKTRVLTVNDVWDEHTNREAFLTTVFSYKESFFKAVSSLLNFTHLRLDICSVVQLDENHFRLASLLDSIEVVIHGNGVLADDYIYTWVIVRAKDEMR